MAKLYDLMDWAEIEALVYSEEDHPFSILGPRIVKDGILVQCFFPGKKSVILRTLADGKDHRMTREDEEGFFAIKLSGKTIPRYVYVIKENKKEKIYGDPYAYPLYIKEKDETLFANGIHYEIYRKLGAHPMRIEQTNGVHFAVWAPNALRVSVVGDFNEWDGRMHPMEKHDASGIFELFIPGVKPGDLYKFEIKLKDGLTYLKSDPYASGWELRPDTASVVVNLKKHVWQDDVWMKRRGKISGKEQPMNIYQLHLGDFKHPEDGREYYNYRELAPLVSSYVKEMGFTHIELMPLAEYREDASLGFQTAGFYAPTSRYGSALDFMSFIDHMHQEKIGVIMEWVPSYFTPEDNGLAAFDGTMLYEHLDPRQGLHPFNGTHLFNYGRPQVSNYLIANALYWAEVFHLDGIRMADLASMLYLDYGKQEGGWVANMYGGNENLEALEFLHHLNSMMKKRNPDVLMIAGDTTDWPQMTTAVEEGGLGFDYKWNEGWRHDLCEYFSHSPKERSAYYDQLTCSMLYAYSESYILSLPQNEFTIEKGSLLERLPGEDAEKFSSLRALMGLVICHPGKKLFFMGQELAQNKGWMQGKTPSWQLLENEHHSRFHEYMRQLLIFYKKQQALSKRDEQKEGFVWINAMAADENMLTFLRCSDEQTLLVVCNFSDTLYEDYCIGVPQAGKYKEIFNSDALSFGGTGMVNKRIKISREVSCDDYDHSIKVKMAPCSVAIFEMR